MRAIYLSVFLLVGCKHVSELQVQQHQEAASAATTETHEVKSEGPEHIVMTVEEYQQLCPVAADPPAPTGTGGSPERLSSADGRPAELRPTTLTRRTVTVTDRGPSLDDLRSWGGWQSKVNTALEVKEEKKSGPVGLFAALLGLWPLILIGGAILAFTLLKPAWVGLAWRVVSGAAKAAFGKKVP